MAKVPTFGENFQKILKIVESGKIVRHREQIKGIVTMKTVEGADKVVANMNGAEISGFKISIEKRLTDPTAPKVKEDKKAEENPVLTPIETKVNFGAPYFSRNFTIELQTAFYRARL